MRLAIAAALAFPLTLSGTEVPIGTNLEIRLTTPVSTVTSHAKDKVEAILIAPVVTEGNSIPAGAALSGTVVKAVAATEEQNASLKLDFAQLIRGKRAYRISTRIYGVDNARETVDEAGVVQGISVRDTITGRLDQGLGKMEGSRLGGLAKILETAKNALVKNADPNIVYGAGTEMTLRLMKPLTLAETVPFETPAPVSDDGHLAELVADQVWQTYSERPPRTSDITNLMFIGEIDQISQAFLEAGWAGAQTLSGESRFETARAIIEQRGYKEAPVSVLLLDNRPPDLVFQKGNNTFSARHHLRIWLSPDTYQGRKVWLSSATHDTGIDFSEADRTFIHKIDSNIDLERSKVVNDLLLTGRARAVTLVTRTGIPTNFRNATGDDVVTDARVAVVQF